MALLRRLFGSKDPLERIRACCRREEWAEAAALIRELEVATMAPEQRSEVEILARASGDGLARLNLEEGEWARRSGNLSQAREHFQLALEQACTEDLRRSAQDALERLAGETGGGASRSAGASQDLACGGSCTPSARSEAPPPAESAEGPEEMIRFELLLATLPEDLASRYAAGGESFRSAWLAGQEGDPDLALQLFDQVPEEERDSLFRTERGMLLLRRGDRKAARVELEAARREDPDLLPALEGLSALLFLEEEGSELEGLLRAELETGRHEGFCWGQLARLHARRGEPEEARAAGRKALALGAADAELVVLCAALEESAGHFAEAEGLLMRLGGGGCGGGVHPLLAEYWLRRGQNLERALESFKGALRQEPESPRWLLRLVQAYLARGWRSEAAVQYDRLLSGGPLPAELQEEAEQAERRLRNP